MPSRNTNVFGYDAVRISSAVADTTVKGTSGVVRVVTIEAKGDAGSTVTLYDGAITGTIVGFVDGTTIRGVRFDQWFSTSIHVVTANPDTNMRVRITYL